MRIARASGFWACARGARGAPARAADDDLSVVRQAVAADAGGATTKDDKPAAPPAEAAAPQWLRVRIVDKGGRRPRCR